MTKDQKNTGVWVALIVAAMGLAGYSLTLDDVQIQDFTFGTNEEYLAWQKDFFDGTLDGDNPGIGAEISKRNTKLLRAVYAQVELVKEYELWRAKFVKALPESFHCRAYDCSDDMRAVTLNAIYENDPLFVKGRGDKVQTAKQLWGG